MYSDYLYTCGEMYEILGSRTMLLSDRLKAVLFGLKLFYQIFIIYYHYFVLWIQTQFKINNIYKHKQII